MKRIFNRDFERLTVRLEQIGDARFKNQYGDNNWGGATVYADYAGAAYALQSKNILELGVLLGYSACAMMLGAHKKNGFPARYIGVDSEQEIPGSNRIAQENMAKLSPLTLAHFVTFALRDQLPAGVREYAPFDLIHVDAIHTAGGTCLTLSMAWDVLAPGGTIILDDAADDLVQQGLWEFLHSLHYPVRRKEEPISLQWYNNETGWVLLQKGER